METSFMAEAAREAFVEKEVSRYQKVYGCSKAEALDSFYTAFKEDGLLDYPVSKSEHEVICLKIVELLNKELGI